MLSTNEGQAPKTILPMDTSEMVFVFGSNLAGRHGAGSAHFAHRRKGAQLGKGLGRMGMSFAIPTKDLAIRTLSLTRIREYVDVFMVYARAHPELKFQITAIGCGLAGYRNAQVAPMFVGAPANCYFDTLWSSHLDNVEFWGTF